MYLAHDTKYTVVIPKNGNNFAHICIGKMVQQSDVLFLAGIYSNYLNSVSKSEKKQALYRKFHFKDIVACDFFFRGYYNSLSLAK